MLGLGTFWVNLLCSPKGILYFKVKCFSGKSRILWLSLCEIHIVAQSLSSLIPAIYLAIETLGTPSLN